MNGTWCMHIENDFGRTLYFLNIVQKLEVLAWESGFNFCFIFYVLNSALLHLPPLRFHCVGGCKDRNQGCCDVFIGSQTL
jgi:hypothetical protein